MKKIIFALLVLTVVFTASCSISTGIPWFKGGWGFFADFGVGFSPSQNAEVIENGTLNLDQVGSILRGSLEYTGVTYEVTGEYLGKGIVALNLFDEEGVLVQELQGTVETDEMTGSNWYAVKEQ